jgi:hypothetical protein
MNTKGNKVIYWGATGLLSAMMLMAAGMYFFNHEMVAELFASLGYPTYIIYPLAVAKILGITAILTKKCKTLKEWAYAGFFYDLVLALSAHLMVGDGEFAGALVALVLLMVSYHYDKKVFKK